MSEAQAVTVTLASLKMAGDMVKAFLDVRGAIQEQGKIFELQARNSLRPSKRT